jgi:cyanoexosortase B-associated protein
VSSNEKLRELRIRTSFLAPELTKAKSGASPESAFKLCIQTLRSNSASGLRDNHQRFKFQWFSFLEFSMFAQLPSLSSRLLRQFQLRRASIALILLILALIGIVPSYVTGQWAWSEPPQVANINQLRSLRETEVPLPGWTTFSHDVANIGNHKWSVQQMQIADGSAAGRGGNAAVENLFLFMLPQDWHDKQPQVEWVDLNGFLGRALSQDGTPDWKTDSQRRLQFTVADPNRDRTVTVKARYFRGWNSTGTYAVLQWYALPDGGSAAPSQWFWADQWSQWQQEQRTPWVAVSVLLPIEPFGEIQDYATTATTIGTDLQSYLMEQALSLSAS